MIDILCFCILGEAIRNRTGPGDDKTHENRKKRISFFCFSFFSKNDFLTFGYFKFSCQCHPAIFFCFSFLAAMHLRLLLVTVVIHLKVNESICDSGELRPFFVSSFNPVSRFLC